ncbi:hypothetical protein [uncultured Allobaculum sp.]|uniref:hypothetical protein n=1 Tax=uncultured Allobaculum sp. TaxID=1187017 RepID=UPI0026242362|nr:hypothetical protein [uncultured Allobaculum sp.]
MKKKAEQGTLDNSSEILAYNIKRLQEAQVLLKEAGVRLAQCIRDSKGTPRYVNWDEWFGNLSDSLNLVANDARMAASKVETCAKQTERLLTKNLGMDPQS